MLRFSDRGEAGRLLAALLDVYRNQADVIVTPVHDRAEEVAEEIAAVLRVGYSARAEALPAVSGTTVVLVDDGFDSSKRVYEASLVARDHGATLVLAAAPVGIREVCREITGLVDRCLCLALPAPFHSTGFWYDDTMQVAAQLLFSGHGVTVTRVRTRRAQIAL